MHVPPLVPETLVRNATELRGGEGAEWANRLPALVADLERRWSLEVGPPFPELSQNWVAPALRADGTKAVLKLSFPEDPEFATEARALRLFDGRGIARLLELDAGRGAMLLEHLEPGVPLDALEDDEEAMSVAADVLRRLWRPAPADHAFPLVSDWARGLARLRRHFGGGTGPRVATERERTLSKQACKVSRGREEGSTGRDRCYGPADNPNSSSISAGSRKGLSPPSATASCSRKW